MIPPVCLCAVSPSLCSVQFRCTCLCLNFQLYFALRWMSLFSLSLSERMFFVSLPSLSLIPDFMIIRVLLCSQVFLPNDFLITISKDFYSLHIFDSVGLRTSCSTPWSCCSLISGAWLYLVALYLWSCFSRLLDFLYFVLWGYPIGWCLSLLGWLQLPPL